MQLYLKNAMRPLVPIFGWLEIQPTTFIVLVAAIEPGGGSSDDQDSVQDDSFMNEAFRAGGPRLCTFPVATDSITPAHSSYQSVTDPTERLTRTIMCLLANAGVRSPSGVQRGNSRQSCFLCGQGLYDVGQSIWTHCYVEDVNTIGCFRIGKSNDWAQNPQQSSSQSIPIRIWTGRL